MTVRSAPLPARPRGPLSENFRRIDPRYDRQLSVELSSDGNDYICRSRNMSLGGMHLECRVPLPIGAAVNLRFQIPTQPELGQSACQLADTPHT